MGTRNPYGRSDGQKSTAPAAQITTTTGAAKTSASGTTDQKASELANQVQQQTSDAADQVQERASQMKDQLVDQVSQRLDDRKSDATGSLGTVAHAFRQTSQHLRERDQDMVAGYTDQAAERLEHFTGYLRERDVSQLIHDVQDFSRREPALFLSGAFALGLLGARFLKSSGPQPTQAPYRQYGQYQPALPAPRSSRYPSATPAVGQSATTTPAANAIVGGPPITDALVGGPPTTPAPQQSRSTPEARSSSDAGA